jgi:hypothetical protein
MMRNILLVALSEERIDGNQIVEGMYELQKSDRHDFGYWFSYVRGEHSDFIITTTDVRTLLPMTVVPEEGVTYVRGEDVRTAQLPGRWSSRYV